jgi:hypothetical protein
MSGSFGWSMQVFAAAAKGQAPDVGGVAARNWNCKMRNTRRLSLQFTLHFATLFLRDKSFRRFTPRHCHSSERCAALRARIIRATLPKPAEFPSMDDFFARARILGLLARKLLKAIPIPSAMVGSDCS